MPEDSWEKNLYPGPGYTIDEDSLRLHQIPGDSIRVRGHTLGENYNHIRESEMDTRFEEVLRSVGRVYFSRYGIGILVISVILSAATSVMSPEGIFFWNVILFVIVWIKSELSARSPVRAEWQDVEEEIDTL
ncbi:MULTISPECIES: hypothetical protein [unclassified Methanoregula]|uniref:hypothetical protein n=1 Tax=unclassified Methanoregula TaxID=2649730 RepID=UPI0009C5AF50|nr:MULTISPECIES: hypothetical protein [unclassified Methanoregula]OPX64094.1 MAG: hypothetical protein A4E33_01117 [Methanoregula sp. PtaB.Bin085]OPY34786.1 MAG: hypothetical protein A4E34_01316 [Methanoregula sp. PtaU1.Bin006]